MSLVARWAIYYVISVLLIIGIHALAIYALDAEEPLFAMMALAVLEAIITVLVIIFQLAIILTNLFSAKVRLRFLAAFSFLYAIADVAFYIISSWVYNSVMTAGDILQQDYGVQQSTEHANAYLHIHLLLLLPLMLQMIIFGMYYRKNKKAKISQQHGITSENQTPAA